MQQRKTLPRLLGVAALAMLFGAGSVYGQSASGSNPSDAAATTSGSSGSAGALSGASGADASGSAQSSSGASNAASGSAGSGSGQISKSDQKVMQEMAHANLSEIAAATLALKQSQNDQVKTFAQQMIDDHTQAQNELEQLAQAKGVTLPKEPDRKHQAMMKKLEGLQGDKFDKQYMAQGGIKDHRETHRKLSRAQDRVTDPDLKALVAKMEPIVEGHLKTAQDASSGKGTASGASMGPAGSSASGSSGASGTPGSSNSTGPSK